MMDVAFTNIPQSTFLAFLQSDEMNVTSELTLYQAGLRWAMAEAKRRDLPENADSLRECLGEALQYFRFLTLTPNEFANIQYTSKVLTYSESLAVIFNLNAPGVMPLPKNLSSNTNTRKFKNNHNQYFKVLEEPSFSPTCQKSELDLSSRNIFDALTTTTFKGSELGNVSPLRNIRIPKAKISNNGRRCQYEDADLTLFIFNAANTILHTQRYKTKCDEVQSQSNTDSQTYNIKLSTDISIPSNNEMYKIKVVFHKPGEYRFTLNTADRATSSTYKTYYRRNYGHQNGYEWILGKDDFVQSMNNNYQEQ